MSAALSVVRSSVAALVGVLAATSPAIAQSRGELLYSTHCISCHTSQMHWRDNKAASDWASLKFQVRRWQGAASLSWSDEDILEVARYLNESIYRFEPSADSLSRSDLSRRPTRS
jgi:mono/diheme cytochrome c family protein